MAPSPALDPATRHTIVVRDGTGDDHDAVRAVIVAAYEQYEPVVGAAFLTRYIADLTDLERHAGHGRLMVAEIDGCIVGSGVFQGDTSKQQFGWPAGWAGGRALAVHPGQRRSGVARSLIKAAEQHAHDCGAPVFAFHTASFMSSAIGLYERLGYLRDPEYDQDLTHYLGLRTRPPVIAIAYRRNLARPGRGTASHHARSATLPRCTTHVTARPFPSHAHRSTP